MIKWTTLVLALSFPFVAWSISSNYLQLSTMTSAWTALGATIISTVALRLFNNYSADGFARSFAAGGSWDYLESSYSATGRPSELETHDLWEGPCFLDDEDIAFNAEIGIFSSGLFLNINVLGRVVVPWKAIDMLKKVHASPGTDPQTFISIQLADHEIRLLIPWHTTLETRVPAAIGISYKYFA